MLGRPQLDGQQQRLVALVAAMGDAKRSSIGTATTFDYGDAIAYGWDDNLPSNCQGEIYAIHVGTTDDGSPTVKNADCYDGLRNFNQVRPGTYDGHYQILTDETGAPLPAGEYIVEFFVPASSSSARTRAIRRSTSSSTRPRRRGSTASLSSVPIMAARSIANGYVHNLEISNNRVTSNAGAYGGGIRIGVPLLVSADAAGVDTYNDGMNDHANIHHNHVTTNGGQSTAGGGIQLCTGSDNYKVQYNFICGNFMSGDGGGIGHDGLSNNGLIDRNTILFDQVFDHSRNDNGAGISIASETSIGANGLVTGTGNVVVSNNVIQGNQAGSGNGGGVYLNGVNGQDVANNPGKPAKWFDTATVAKGTYFLATTNLNYLVNGASDDYGGLMTEIVVQ